MTCNCVFLLEARKSSKLPGAAEGSLRSSSRIKDESLVSIMSARNSRVHSSVLIMIMISSEYAPNPVIWEANDFSESRVSNEEEEDNSNVFVSGLNFSQSEPGQ